MVYGFRIIGREYYSEWGFESISKTKKNLERIVKIVKGKKEIFEKTNEGIKVIEFIQSLD